MALSNSDFNLIMREYEERRYKSKWELDRRLEEVYERIPELKQIQDEISSVAVSNMKNRLLGILDGDNATKKQLHDKIKHLVARKNKLLEEYGYSPLYLKQEYVCEDCRDTGYIENEKCHCLKEKITRLLYSRSNLEEILCKENFSTFDISLYSNEKTDAITGDSAAVNIRKVLEDSRDFVKNFGKDFRNLFIYGETGVGKTFLTNCIAKEIMDRSHSVIYISAIRMFEILADEQFGRSDKGAGTGAQDFIDCDLLIIDDLGTEMVNSFTSSALFNCINERFLKSKPVIISTNLSIGQVRDVYSERVFSRIASNYTMLKIFGDDLRIVTSLGLTKS